MNELDEHNEELASMVPSSAVIFDFDGTLANTKPLVVDVLNQYTHKHGLRKVSDISDFRNVVLENKLYFNLRLFNLQSTIQQNVLDHIEKNVSELKLYPGMDECIAQLYDSGYKLGILTTNRENTVNAFLKKHSMEPYFAFINSNENKRQALEQIIKKHGLPTETLFYAGDQASDITSTSGLARTIAVTWGFEDYALLNAANPNYIVSQPNEIIEVVKNFKQQDNTVLKI